MFGGPPIIMMSRRGLLPPSTPLRTYSKGAVGQRATTFSQISATNVETLGRSWHPAAQNLTKIGITVGDFRVANNTPAESYARVGSTITWEAWWEYPAGTFTRLTFSGGSNTFTTANGELAESDELTMPVPYVAGDDAWVWLRAVNPAGGMYYNAWRNAAKGEGQRTTPTPGAIESVPSSSIVLNTNFTMPPLVVWSSEAAIPSVLVSGDSKGAGFGDLPQPASTAGWLQRGLIARCIPDNQGYLNISSGGSRAGNNVGNDWVTVWTARKKVLKYFSHHFFGPAFNDLFVDNRSAAELKAAIEVALADIRAANAYARITLPTIGPRGGSTSGGWTSLGDQTVAGNDTARLAHNANVRSGAIANNNNGYFEIANLIDAGGADTGKWAMPPNRSINDAAITAASSVLTSATANFTSADIGLGVSIVGAGVAGARLNRYIASVTDATTAVLSNTANTTVSGALATIGTPTTDGLHETPERYGVPAASGTIDVSAKLAV